MKENKFISRLSVFGFSYLFRILIACTVLLPAYTRLSNNDDFMERILSNVIILFLMGWYYLFYRKNVRQPSGPPKIGKGSRLFLLSFLTVLILYNGACYYFNGLKGQWYWDQANYTIDFLFLLFLIFCVTPGEIEQFRLFPFFTACIALAAAAACFLYHSGLQAIQFCWYFTTRWTKDYLYVGDSRCSFLYPHKSQYALILVMGIFMLLRQFKRFQGRLVPAAVIAALLYALKMCDTMAAFGAVAVGALGLIPDMLRKRGLRLNRYAIAGLCAIAAFTYAAFAWISKTRKISTLGTRTYIWQGGIRAILENPAGIGSLFGQYMIDCGHKISVNNCHNVFLNHALHYSIPAGLLFALLFLALIIFSFYRSPNCFTLSSWAGILILLNMDQSILPNGFPFFILQAYFIYFYPAPPVKPTRIRPGTKP